MRTQRGFGLVEMMVAVTIGLFLILGLGAIFISMRQTSIARQGLSALQDSERMAMTLLGAGIQGAGFYPNPLTTTAATQFPAAGAFAGGQSISGTGNGGGYGAASPVGTDTLSVRFVASALGVVQGCSTPLVAGTLYKDVFSVSGGNLVCTENGTAYNLVAGVQGMSVLYGVDTAGSVTQYLPASSVTSWANIKTVSVTLQFANPLAGQPGQPTTVSFTRTIPYMNGL